MGLGRQGKPRHKNPKGYKKPRADIAAVSIHTLTPPYIDLLIQYTLLYEGGIDIYMTKYPESILRLRTGLLPIISLSVILGFFNSPSLLFSLPKQKLVYPDDWAYEALAVLSREGRIVWFADSVLTVGQIERLLTEIDEESLSPNGKVLYERLVEYLELSPGFGFQSDVITVRTDPVLQGESYFKTNRETPWIYDYYSRKPLITLPLELSLSSYITIEMDPILGENEYAASMHDNYINIPFDIGAETDLHFPKRAYISAGYPFGQASGVQLALGQGENFFGRTRTGSIILSDHLDKVSYARFAVYSPLVKLTSEVTQYGVNKYQYMHYIQVRPHRTFSLSLAEGVMANAPLELRFLNPFMIFHGFESYKTYSSYNQDLNKDRDDPVYESSGASRIGSYFGAKIEWQPLTYTRFYGLLAMNQLQLPIEHEKWEEDLTPNALAFQAGTEVSIPGNRGYWLFGLEGVYTYPYMYILHHKDWSFYK
jgi:hypothetical protein